MSKIMDLPVIPYRDWLQRVQKRDDTGPGLDFGPEFLHVGLGAIGLDTSQAGRVSRLTLSRPVSASTLASYARGWGLCKLAKD